MQLTEKPCQVAGVVGSRAAAGPRTKNGKGGAVPCVKVKDKSGKVTAVVCLRHDSPAVQRMSPAEREALAESLATELIDCREQQRKILEFPRPPSETKSGGEK